MIARRTMLTALGALLAAGAAQAQGQASDSLTFVVLGHVRGNADGKLNYLIDQLIAEVRRDRPDVVFLAGDIIWGEYNEPISDRAKIVREWEALDAKVAQLGVPVHRVPGNHDISDPVTRDVWIERYGALPRTVDIGNARFLLLTSAHIPEGDSQPPLPRPYVRGTQLDSAQIDYVRRALADSAAPRHRFVVMHHMLWWEEDARWWSEVHPHLVRGNVRAVFGGDYGPMKFSHTRRDGVDYIQTSMESDVGVEMLRAFESSRLLSQQFDNYVVGTVAGDSVTYEVRTIAAIAGERYTPERWRAVHRFPDQRSIPRKLWDLVGTPKRLAALAVVLGGTLIVGLALGVFVGRRRARVAA